MSRFSLTRLNYYWIRIQNHFWLTVPIFDKSIFRNTLKFKAFFSLRFIKPGPSVAIAVYVSTLVIWSEIDIEIKINGNIISRSLGRLERDDIQDIAFKPVGNLKGNIISYSCQSNCLSLCLWLGSRSSLGPPEVLMLKISELTVFRHFWPWNCSHQGSKLVIFL